MDAGDQASIILASLHDIGEIRNIQGILQLLILKKHGMT